MSIRPKPRDAKYEETVRVLWGYAPNRADPLPCSSRNRARKYIWKTFNVEMDHSRDNGYFRVTYDPSNAHCPDYCQDHVEWDDEEEEGKSDSWFEEQCACGVVHDGSSDDHDTVQSEGAGSVYNVKYPRHWLHEPELPRTLQQEGVDHGNDGNARAGWQPDDDGIRLSVTLRTGGSRPVLFLTDDEGNGTSSFVQAIVFRFSSDGIERRGPSVKMEYASDVWLQHVDSDGETTDTGTEEDEVQEDDEVMEDEEEAADMELDPEQAEAEQVADGFWASTPPDSGDGSIDEDDSGDDDSDSDSAGHSWYYAHNDRILHLLSEWQDRMQREHGLLGRMHIFSLPHEGKPDWFRQLPGLARPVAKTAFGSSERPHMGLNLHTVRAREEGRHNLLGGLQGARHKYHTSKKTLRTGQRMAPPIPSAGKHYWPSTQPDSGDGSMDEDDSGDGDSKHYWP